MSDVADEVRRRHQERIRRMSPDERVELALALGDEAQEGFRRRHGLSREEAFRILRARRQEGRTPCSFLGERE
jgi:hypothetical protein